MKRLAWANCLHAPPTSRGLADEHLCAALRSPCGLGPALIKLVLCLCLFAMLSSLAVGDGQGQGILDSF